MTNRSRFFNKKSEFLTLHQIIQITGAKPFQTVDLNQKFYNVATIDAAQLEDIAFINSGSYIEKLLTTKAGVCILEERHAKKAPSCTVALTHNNPYFAYCQIAANLFEEKKPEFLENLSIHPSAKIGSGTVVAPGVYIGKNVEIGQNCQIHANAVIMDNCLIGNNCIIGASSVISFAIIGNDSIIYSGAKIGQDGFGFAHDAGINHKIIQLGIVEIGNSVEIGANSCVDRGAIENTIIMDGVKIDNLVQVAHNVIIGKGTVIAGCTAIAGSCKIGNYVQIGGNCSIGGHLTVGDGVKIAGMSGVMRDIDPREIVAGIPVLPIRQWHKVNSKLNKMTTNNKSS